MRALAALAAASCATAVTMNLTLFDLGRLPTAVCNDGSPAGYFFAPSTTGSDLWIVHQQGGGWCFNAGSCEARVSSGLTSSTGWNSTLYVGGLFAPTDPRLQTANFVYLRYCSSDAWTGMSSAAGNDFGFKFYGAAIAQAVFTSLVEDRGMGRSGAAEVLYSGCSAGARGVLFNLPMITTQLQGALGPRLARVGGLLDSAFWLEMTPMLPSIVPLWQQAQINFALFNASGHLNPACLAAFPADQQWKCMMGQWAVPHLSPSFPYLLYAFQYDAYQIPTDEGVSAPTTPAQLAYAEAFRNATRGNATLDTIAPAVAGTAALLPACFKHCNTETSTFSTMTTQGVSLEAATAAWFFGLPPLQGSAQAALVAPRTAGDAAVSPFIMEDCTGFNCGTTCPPA